MKVVGISFKKISAERPESLEKFDISNAIKFSSFEKENVDLFQDKELYKLGFSYSISYFKPTEKKSKKQKKLAEVLLEGFVNLVLDKNEAKEFQSSWKKKEVPRSHTPALYNFILKRCSAKAVALQDELNLPSPFLRYPQVRLGSN